MPDKTTNDKSGDRIAKVIARAGLTSRREAEAWIAAGRVTVNGKAISSPALNVGPRDRIVVDGQPLPRRARTRLFLHNKMRGLVTTHSDPEGRPTIFGALPKHLPRLISVGRLDMNTEGLLLLTNDGGLARVLELPKTAWLRAYRVRALGRVTQEALDKLRKGVTVEGVHYGPIEATLDREQGANVWLTFAIKEGKNREVRKVLESLGLKVNRLIRVSYGPFELGALDDGEVKEVETAALRKELGEAIATEAEADFEGPLENEETRGRDDRRHGGRDRKGSHRHPEARARETREPRRMTGKAAAGAIRGPRDARPPQGDGERPETGRFSRKKRRRADRSGGPRPSRPRPK
jgi:23S rRNA pseudouridine2605 synthase